MCKKHYERVQNTGSTEIRDSRIPLAARFWSKVDKAGECWLWTGALSKGYGQFNTGNHTTGAHRLAYILTHGPIDDEIEVGHNCPGGDNPRCVRPSHMLLLTPAEHALDRVLKNQVNRGERCYNAVLTDSAVSLIRKRYAAGGVSHAQLARDFETTRSNVQKIVRGKSWTHVVAIDELRYSRDLGLYNVTLFGEQP